MSLSNDLLLKYGVNTVEELFEIKSNKEEKHVHKSPADRPRRVKLTSDQCKKLCEKISLDYKEGYENRVIERIVTTEAVDRDGDIIIADGVDHKNYAKNPVVLFAHDKTGLPVGNSIKWWKDDNINRFKGWRSYDLYFDNELDTSGMSDLVFRFVLSGAMPGGSIGFSVIDAKYDYSEEERKKLGLGKYGVVYLKTEKLEHSVCSVPANQDALARQLKSIDNKKFLATFSKEDADRLAAEKALDDELIDVFYSVLGGSKTVVNSPMFDFEHIDKDGPVENNGTIVMNLSFDKMYDEMKTFSDAVNSFNENIKSLEEKVDKTIEEIKDAQKQFSDKVSSILTIIEKTANNRKQDGLYDSDGIKDILKF